MKATPIKSTRATVKAHPSEAAPLFLGALWVYLAQQHVIDHQTQVFLGACVIALPTAITYVRVKMLGK